jgi:transcriptional regulator with XRE-family HTH domain|tara:strand:+ start:11994 stop:12197 length:204 start_codon:yes stop_codon:yes gene_type:complete
MHWLNLAVVVLRNERKLTQKDLAKSVGCSPNTIANLERGSTNIKFETIEKIIDILGYEFDIHKKEKP